MLIREFLAKYNTLIDNFKNDLLINILSLWDYYVFLRNLSFLKSCCSALGFQNAFMWNYLLGCYSIKFYVPADFHAGKYKRCFLGYQIWCGCREEKKIDLETENRKLLQG